MNHLIKRIKTLQNLANIDQDAHKQNVKDVSMGRTDSCARLDDPEMHILILRYQNMAPKKQGKQQLPPQLKMIYSLWGQLHTAGLVNTNSKQACDTFCEKYLKGKTLAQSAAQWHNIIEVLKAWLKRAEKHPQNNTENGSEVTTHA
ncbi:phage protein GemA/Gp16 family protein [Pseudoalteromonas denitrificans]|uniref:Mu-like prophage protein gp16 n=1 Tax=Pseudoalteromonas denitrificans DSM 6059 TaxID=1123010 RepID=A0A1I1G586_9GAMM|nr:phage protein GemA/Gp16 family protein [Pseudoalteromonas denitrificans]SFC04340.1 Protein of unknown function [Pseudoalteromonas denitrificans DSM 6059]